MTRAQKVGCWLGAVVSLVAAGYFGTSVVFYAWLSAAEPDRWPSDRAAIYDFGSISHTLFMPFTVTVKVRQAASE
jgi:hypothetical protein